jgi:hypothetical protein
MINNALELSKVLCDQAKNSGFAKSAIVIIMTHDGNISKTEFGLNRVDMEDSARNSDPIPIENKTVEGNDTNDAEEALID